MGVVLGNVSFIHTFRRSHFFLYRAHGLLDVSLEMAYFLGFEYGTVS